MTREYNAIMTNDTWELVLSHPSQNLVGYKWVYKVKHNSDGMMERHKAKLVAQIFHQQVGIDYHETFSAFLKPATIRPSLSLAILYKWSIHQLDVKNIVLQEPVTEVLYMK